MYIYARQGDVIIREHAISDKNLTPTIDLVVAGASTHPHTILGPCEFVRDERATLVRISSPTTLVHSGQHRPVPLIGDYHLSVLRERGDKFDRQVED